MLSDPRRRGIYDKFGEEGLYGDVPPEDDDFFEDSAEDATEDNQRSSYQDDYADHYQDPYHPPPPPTSAPAPPSAPNPPPSTIPQPPPGMAPKPPVSREEMYGSYSSSYSARSSVNYSDSRPASASYADSRPVSTNYSDSRPASTNYSDSRPTSTNYSDSRPTSTNYSSYPSNDYRPDARPKSTTLPATSHPHAHHAHSNQPDPFEIFKRFFGTQDFRQAASARWVMTMHISISENGMSFLNTDKPAQQDLPEKVQEPVAHDPSEVVVDPPVFRDLNCSLEDLYNGVRKRMRVTRKVVNAQGECVAKEKVIEFEVKRGWREGMKVTFKKWGCWGRVSHRLGDERPGHIPADIVFVVKEKPHAKYQREGNDLVFWREISLREALCGCRFEYEHINGRKMNVVVPAVITPESEQVYHGLGMPIAKSENEYGDLVIRFHIRFPRTITPEHKDIVRSLAFLDD